MIRYPSKPDRWRARRGQHGQILILFALAAIVVLGMVAIAVDGGYGLVQFRRAQNAADFAAVAGTNQLKGLCSGAGNAPSNQTVFNAIQDVVDVNASAVGGNWTGTYLDSSSNVIKDGLGNPIVVTNSSSTAPPTQACGVTVQVNPQWAPFLAQILGYKSLTSTASAKSVVKPGQGNPIGIVALDEVSPHEILGGGTGNFVVYGTIFANSTVPYNPWGQGQIYHGYDYVDVVDAKDNSNLILHGIMQSVGANWPLDWCFGSGSPADQYNATDRDNDGDNDSDPSTDTDKAGDSNADPYNNAVCTAGPVTLKYNHINISNPQITDPLLPNNGIGGVGDPFVRSDLGNCPPASSPPTIGALPAPVMIGGVSTYVLQPGDYTFPVIIPSSANVLFADCSGAYDAIASNTAVYPGIFRFEKGLDLQPAAGRTVLGNNVMIATGDPLPLGGNVPGTVSGGVFTQTPGVFGNGAPCFPTGVNRQANDPETDGSSPKCGGTDTLPSGPYYGVRTWNQTNYNTQTAGLYGTGTNFSLVIGGQGTVTLTSPGTGPYRDLMLFQKRGDSANLGLNAEPNDSATVTLTGLVYDTSVPCYGFPGSSATAADPFNGSCTTAQNYQAQVPNNPFSFWDLGTTYHPGGTLQTGVGIGTGYPNPSTGSVTVNGTCLVGDFNTDGNTTITIDGRTNTYALPGVLGSGNPPIVG
jgi:Flp pilus assembly protein TadG